MAVDFSQFRRDISSFLASLRRAVDRPYRLRTSGAQNRERILRAILSVEEARIRFNTAMRYQGDPSPAEWDEIRGELLRFVDNFIHSSDIPRDVYDRPFRVVPMIGPDRDQMSPFMRSLAATELTVSDAIVGLRRFLENASADRPNQTSLGFEDLQHIVPRQQIAPVRFDVRDFRIVVADRAPATLEADRTNIASALEHIQGTGDQLIQSLEN